MNNKFPALIVLLFLAAAVAVFLALFERYEQQQDMGQSLQADRNPYLAAQQYLQQHGSEVVSYGSLQAIEQLSSYDTLIVDDSRNVLSQRQLQVLQQWLGAGGHLIVAAGDSEDDDLLLQAFGVNSYDSECDCSAEPDFSEILQPAADSDDEQESQSKKLSEQLRKINRQLIERIAQEKTDQQQQLSDRERRQQAVAPEQLSTLRFENEQQPLTIHFDPSRALYQPQFDSDEELEADEAVPDETVAEEFTALYAAGSDFGWHFLQLEVADGLLTVIGDSRIWQSNNIGVFDHAYLLHVLTAAGGGAGQDPSRVAILFGSQMPSLSALAWRHGRESIIASSLLIVLWIFYRSRRFAQPRLLQLKLRRSLAEHSRAAALFLWSQEGGEALLAPLRREIMLLAARSSGEFVQLSEQRQYQWLAAQSGLTAQQVAQALSEVRSRIDEEEFIFRVQYLQSIRRALQAAAS